MTRSRPNPLRARLVACCAALLLALPAGCGDAPREGARDPAAQAYLDDLEARMAAGEDPGPADGARLSELAAANPQDPLLQRLVFAVLPFLEDWEGLARAYERLPARTPEQDLELARLHLRLGSYARAAELLDPLADAHPSAPQPNALAGQAHFLLGDDERAAAFFDRVWDDLVASGAHEYVASRGRLYFRAGDPERALATLRLALELEPASFQAHDGLARVLAAEGRAEEAEAHAARARELQATSSAAQTRQRNQEARMSALEAAVAAEEWARAEELVLTMLPDSETAIRVELYRLLEGVYRRAGREDELPAALERARRHARGVTEPPEQER